MKKIFIAVAVMLLLILPVSAESYENDDYRTEYERLGLEELVDRLPDREKNELHEIRGDNGDIVLSLDKAVAYLETALTDVYRAPLSGTVSLVGILLLYAVATAIAPVKEKTEKGNRILLSVLTATVLVMPCYSLFCTVSVTLETICDYLASVTVIFAGILSAAGQFNIASVSSVTLLAGTGAVRQLFVHGILPFSGSLLGIGSASVFLKNSFLTRLNRGIKRVMIVAITALSALFSGFLSLQTVLASSADSLALRTVRLVAGSTPFVGAAVRDAASLMATCFGSLKHTAGAVVMIAVTLCILPSLLEVWLWRFGVFVVGGLANTLECTESEELCETVSQVLQVLSAVLVAVWVTFVISFTLLSTVGGAGS